MKKKKNRWFLQNPSDGITIKAWPKKPSDVQVSRQIDSDIRKRDRAGVLELSDSEFYTLYNGTKARHEWEAWAELC